MSVNYADALSPYPNKGKVGMKELQDDLDIVRKKAQVLVDLMRNSRHTVVIVGAGISTSAGIPDFRGPNGVWTLEKKGLKPKDTVADFMQAEPTRTHRALVALQKAGFIHFIVSQNIDGLLHRAGFPLSRLAEVHGNVFAEKCPACKTMYLRQKSPVPTMTLKPTGRSCEQVKASSRHCRGILRDTILDWEDELPEPELSISMLHAKSASLCLCLGTSLQIFPVAGFPNSVKRNGGKVVVVNLQKTRIDKLSDCRIFAPVDDVMSIVVDLLRCKLEECSEICQNSGLDNSSSIPLLNNDFKLNQNF